MKKIKIAILGDSISEGIGKKKINYINSLQNILGNNYDIKNFAHTGTTIYYALDIVEEIKRYSPNIILVMYGNVDAQIRPNISGNRYNIDKFIPKRYKNNGMLDPRPFYSSKWYRIVPDRIDNIFRLIIRKIIVKTQGVCQWVNSKEFEEIYQKFLDNFNQKDVKIFLVSTIKLDEKNYPKCIEQYRLYNKIINNLCSKNNCCYIDLFNYVEDLLEVYEWNKIFYFDHYHPNIKGYELIAKLFSKHILEIQDKW
ncbi:TPA: SGNH/GDSL hydrolase family protein [Clostridium perfringens]